MMADFPPNLDDGELWLPSEIIADVGVRRRHHCQDRAAVPPRYQSDLSYIEDLAQQLAAFGLLDRSHPFSTSKPNPNLYNHPEGFMPGRRFARYGPAEREVAAGFVFDGFRPPSAGRVVSGFGNSGYYTAARVPQQLNSGLPVQPQVDPLGQGRARVLQRHGLNRVIPPVRLRGSGRECGGTGVFLPRVAIDEDVRNKKPCMKVGEQQQLQTNRNAAARRQGMLLPLQPLSETGLPPDWTY